MHKSYAVYTYTLCENHKNVEILKICENVIVRDFTCLPLIYPLYRQNNASSFANHFHIFFFPFR